MSWLEDLLSQGIGRPPAAGFPALPHEQQFDPAHQAEEARQAAALQMIARSGRRGPGEMATQQPVPFQNLGMLNPAEPAAPPTPEPVPALNDPLAREPQPFVNGAPLPRPRPDTPPEPASPMSLAPPEQAEIPATARPTAGTAPPAAPLNNSPPGPGIGGILGKLFDPANAPLLMAMGGGFAGAPSFGTGMRRAFSEGAPQAALLRQEQLKLEPQNATYKALVAKGIPNDIARAASTNKDLLAQLLPQVFGTKKFTHVTLKDGLGNEIPLSYDDSTGKYYQGGKEYLQQGAGVSGPGANLEPKYNEHGLDEDFLKTQDPITQATVKAIVAGDANVSGRNLQKYLPYAVRYDQNFKGQQDYNSRQNLEKSYRGGGEGFKQLRAANTAITHGVQLIDAIKGLHNFDTLPILNAPTGAIARQYDKKYQEARKSFEANAEPFARELDFALTGKSTVSGQHEIRKLFDVNAATPENMAAITRVLGLLKGRVDEHEYAYQNGRKSLKLPLEALSEKNRNSLEGIVSGGHPRSETPAATPAATAPAATTPDKPQIVRQNGHTYTLQPDGTYK